MQQRRRRNTLNLGLLMLGLLAGAALTAGPAQAFVSGPGPLYPEPAWDQIKGAGRFLVLTNWASAAVLDKETGLVWERSPSPTPQTWSNARFACTALTTGNRKGWRLPSVHELESLIDPSQINPINPALPLLHPFPTVLPDSHWSATTDAENSTQAWFVDVLNGNVASASKAANAQVWCVRGGMNAEAY
jgi:hypothetical protein